MKKKIFISYSHQDEGLVEWLKNGLKDQDLEIWHDRQKIQFGDNLQEKITDGIQSSDVFILVLSSSSIHSNWVKYEMNSALLLNAIKKGITILPIKIDESNLPPDLSGYSFLDFSTNREKALESLKRSLLKINKVAYEFQDWSNFNAKTFENLVFDLLTSEGFIVKKKPPIRDGGYDFTATINSALGIPEKIIIESKLYNGPISIDIIRNLYAVAAVEKVNKVLLVTNSELTNSSREYLKNTASNVTVWEGHELITRIFSFPDLVEKYFPKNKKTSNQPIQLIDIELQKVQNLIKKLDDCPEGKIGWKLYEDICAEILTYLFVPPLGEPKIQSRRESGIDVRDVIFPNRTDNANWKFIREDYNAKYIVFEFKNYSENGSSEIDKYVLLQISDYLKKNTMGGFGIICSKKHPNKSGLEKRKDIFSNENKLILFVNNENLKEMLLRKYKKMDPADVISGLIDDFNIKF